MKTRTLFLAVLVCSTAFSAQPAFRFAEATIDDLQARMAAGKLTAHELTAAYLQRIAEFDRAGPGLHAVIELNPDAPAIADQLDESARRAKCAGRCMASRC